MDKLKEFGFDNNSEKKDTKIIRVVGFCFRCIILVLVVLYILLYFCLQLFVNFAPDKDMFLIQKQVGKLAPVRGLSSNSKYTGEIEYLTGVKNKIIKMDANFKNDDVHKIFVLKSDTVNAFIDIDGNIYFTTACLDKIKNKKELSYIIAHELGHYSGRHTIQKMTGRITLLGNLGLVAITKDKTLANLVDKAIGFQEINYSKRQEAEAEKYASSVYKKLYGANSKPPRMVDLMKAK